MNLKLIDVPAAAEMFGVSAGWLHREVTAGRVQHTRVGRLVKFSEDDLNAFVTARTRPASRRLRGAA